MGKTLDGKCLACGHVFTVADLPKPMHEVAKLCRRAKCPECGGKKIGLAPTTGDSDDHT